MCYRMYRSVSECIGDGDTLCAIGLYRTIGLCIGRLSDYRTLYRMAIGLCIGQLSDRQTIEQLSDGLPTVNPTVKRNLRAHVLPLSTVSDSQSDSQTKPASTRSSTVGRTSNSRTVSNSVRQSDSPTVQQSDSPTVRHCSVSNAV